jgi:Rrf2 family nitric oxide-sensitive transcriptional repressor
MHLTRFSDNALRCLMVVGLEPDRAVPVPEIATRMNMSYEHLVKIVQRLAALGYIETVRGRHGGVRLAIDPASIRLSTIIRQTEDNLALVECFTGEDHSCPIAPACRLATVLDDALTAFFAVLEQKSLADVLKPKRDLLRLMRPVIAG